MTDRWENLFALQRELASMYHARRPLGFYAQEPITRCTTWTRAIIHEACELEDELNWKPWKNPEDLAANRKKRLDEMADILHFFLELALDQEFSPDEVYSAYQEKREVNRLRQEEDPAYRSESF